MRILALDQATRVSGYAIFDSGKLIDCGKIITEDEDLGKRLVVIRQQIINLIEKYNIEMIAFEDIQLQGQTNNVATYKSLAEVFGVVHELSTELKIPYEIVHSQTWKSALGIKGRDRATQKKNAQAFVSETYGKKVSQDESDAICIGTYTVKEKESAF